VLKEQLVPHPTIVKPVPATILSRAMAIQLAMSPWLPKSQNATPIPIVPPCLHALAKPARTPVQSTTPVVLAKNVSSLTVCQADLLHVFVLMGSPLETMENACKLKPDPNA
jgi:hypothetical protein